MSKVKPAYVLLLLVSGGLLLALFAAGGITVWEYTNSDAFCTNACHAVHPEESVNHRNYYHARVKCVECHIGRIPTLQAMAHKTEHVSELWGMITGYQRPLRSTTLRPARESCERCHWPAAFHQDSLMVVNDYADDRPSTHSRTLLTMHTGGGLAREGQGRGIHWHTENHVEFVATDVEKQNIPWVGVTYLDGRTATYTDTEHPLTPEQVSQNPSRLMDCLDCHNRVGHPFPDPEKLVDQAIALGQLNRALPFMKQKAMALVDQALDLNRHHTFTRDRARDLSAQAAEDYRLEFPDIAKTHADSIEAAQQELTQLMLRVTFKSPGISWRSFPQNTGHKDFPGCFRCHDGKHINSRGEAIPLQCNLCHDLPKVTVENRPAPGPDVIVPGASPLPNHLQPDFMRTHGTLVDTTCQVCHGKIEYGKDDSSFCANPACHGRNWPTFGAVTPTAKQGDPD